MASMIGVALKFLPDQDKAPVVVAAGDGILGELIQKMARKHSVPTVQDANLAKILVRVPVGEEVPENLYRAVAKVYHFIFELEKDLQRREETSNM
jgi:flagellar biosynthesis protein